MSSRSCSSTDRPLIFDIPPSLESATPNRTFPNENPPGVKIGSLRIKHFRKLFPNARSVSRLVGTDRRAVRFGNGFAFNPRKAIEGY